MLNTLASGTSLVVDRYAYSGMAYTLAKQLPGLNAQVGTCNPPRESPRESRAS